MRVCAGNLRKQRVRAHVHSHPPPPVGARADAQHHARVWASWQQHDDDDTGSNHDHAGCRELAAAAAWHPAAGPAAAVHNHPGTGHERAGRCTLAGREPAGQYVTGSGWAAAACPAHTPGYVPGL